MIHPIYYASKILSDTQDNYITTKKDLLIVIFAIKKYRSYIADSKVTVHTNHSTIRYLMAKKDAKL